ncbi:MAG: hypothetical protein V3U98_10930 [Acidobacteriota bacterium]
MLRCALDLGPGSRTVGFPSIDLGFLTLPFVVFLFSLSFHEMAHAWAADVLPGADVRHYEALRPYGILLLYALVVSPLWGDLIVPVVEQTYRLLLHA